jgi:choline dehydrogenase-like flavoprotein
MGKPMIVLFRDLANVPPHDVCIIGAGPVGIAIALACEAAGLAVLLIESGLVEPGAFAAGLTAGHGVDPLRHVPPDIAACRALGGTSLWWGGRCVPFDDVDFSNRVHVPEAAWPIAHDDVRRWYEAAADFFGIGPATFTAPPRWMPPLGEVHVDRLERWTPQINMGRRHGLRLRASRRLTVVLGATVTDLQLSADATRVASLTLRGPQRSMVIAPPTTVLACGGLETTRLLLWAQTRWPNSFGGRGGPLGRTYMGHIFGQIADVVLDDPRAVADHDFFLDQGAFCRRRFVVSEAVQRREGLLNAAFWLDKPPFHDPRHQDGVLSLIWLALAITPIGRRLVSEGLRQHHIGPRPGQWHKHIANVLRAPISTLSGLRAICHARFVSRPRKPGSLVANVSGRYALQYHAEHAPNPESRVVLSPRRDALGLPFLDVDLVYGERDAVSVVRSHEVLDEALRAAGVGRLDYRLPDRAARVAGVLEQARDGYHQIGLTRMSAAPDRGVVDADCRVHGLDNLFIAGASVLPTSGQANPTFAAVALGLRLAAHLAKRTGVQHRAAIRVRAGAPAPELLCVESVQG